MYNSISTKIEGGVCLHTKIKKKSYLLGLVWLLCPTSLQLPQERLRFAGEGVCSSATSDGMGCSRAAGVVARPGSGMLGFGHVMSLSSSGQNGLICSNRYHWWSALKPRGGGNSCASGDQDSFKRSTLSSVESECSFTNTDPGVAEDIRKWWYFLIPGSFLK